jgi:O-antigen ligase
MSGLSNTLVASSSENGLHNHEQAIHRRKREATKSGSDSPSLMMSDYWFLAGLILALFYVADPFFWRLDKIGPTKHLPLIISFFGVMLANVGSQVFNPSKSSFKHNWQVLKAGLPLILLGIWIVIGSLYTRKFNGINNTFITVGLYMLFAFLAARVVMISPARASIVRAYLLAATTLGIFMVMRMATNYDGMSYNYHELEALIIPLAVYFALRPSGLKNTSGAQNNDKSYSQVLFILFFLGAGLVFRKNTGFLVLLLTLFYIWIAEWRFRFSENIAFRFWTIFWISILLISAVAAAGYFAQQKELLPSGNPEYRLLTYDVAWNKFISSPIWGTGFSGQATEKFTAYTISSAKGNLATHSDILDIAAQGGVIALCLWLWGCLRVSRISLRHALKGDRPRDDLRAAAHTFACMSLASIVVYAFNPILLQPAKSLLLWSHFGMLLGITLHLANQHMGEASTKPTSTHTPNTKPSTIKLSHA